MYILLACRTTVQTEARSSSVEGFAGIPVPHVWRKRTLHQAVFLCTSSLFGSLVADFLSVDYVHVLVFFRRRHHISRSILSMTLRSVIWRGGVVCTRQGCAGENTHIYRENHYNSIITLRVVGEFLASQKGTVAAFRHTYHRSEYGTVGGWCCVHERLCLGESTSTGAPTKALVFGVGGGEVLARARCGLLFYWFILRRDRKDGCRLPYTVYAAERGGNSTHTRGRCERRCACLCFRGGCSLQRS